jgi:hypothetical protein
LNGLSQLYLRMKSLLINHVASDTEEALTSSRARRYCEVSHCELVKDRINALIIVLPFEDVCAMLDNALYLIAIQVIVPIFNRT